MEKKVMRKRDGGRPNRGGGRQNRRGRGNAHQTAPNPAKPTGAFASGRKSGASAYDDDDVYDAYDDDYGEDDFQFKSQSMSQQPKLTGVPSQHGRGRVSRGAGTRGTSFRGQRVKVTMQQLHMSTENQELVKDMLKDLHGADTDHSSDPSEDELEYDVLDYRAENQYWITDNKLKLEDSTSHGALLEDASSEQSGKVSTLSTLALNKLARYGFDKQKCKEALLVCDGDLGMALEYLLAEAFSLNSCDSTISAEDRTEFEEQRNEEMMALQSIYDEKFIERIPNKVWAVKLDLPHLDKLIMPKRKEKPKLIVKTVTDDRVQCKFFLKGFCKFGRRCRMKHDKPSDKPEQTDRAIENIEHEHEIEIRFPSDNMYPKEAPYLAFYSTSMMEKHICLNITKHLIAQAKSLAETCEPSIFSVIGLLDDETFLEGVVSELPHESSLSPNNRPLLYKTNERPSPVSIEHIDMKTPNDSQNGNDQTSEDLSSATQSMMRMTSAESSVKNSASVNRETTEKVAVQRSTSKSNTFVKKPNQAEVLKANRRLKDDFKRKQSESKYKGMQEVRQRLPAWDKQDEILQMIDNHQVIVISGMTGCGKTTQVPQFILDHYLRGSEPLCNIVCTQPRRISAMAVAERVAEERTEALGRSVGYQIRLEKVQSSLTRLLFCTTGIVLRRLEADTTLDGITHLIIDEVHERSEESDFLMMYLRDMLPRRPDLKIILMSATLNADLFATYFGGCAVLDIPGRTFPVDQYFLEDILKFTRFVMEESSTYARPLKHMNAVAKGMANEEMSGDYDNAGGSAHKASDRVQDQNLSVKHLYLRYADYPKSAVKSLAMMDHTKINFDLVLELMTWLVKGNHDDLKLPSSGAILVFMPGYAEIQTLFDMLQSSPVFRNNRRYRIIPLHSTLSSEEQHAVFSKPPDGVTKIVIATNIAETSITIDDVCFVIDTGKMKEKRYDPTKGMESLDMVWVSRANALQRKGRAGRVQSGVCFHLFTSHRFEHHLLEQPVPEIRRAPLEQILLRIKMLDIFKSNDVKDVLQGVPDPPDIEAISLAVKRLEVLGALSNTGELTPLGYHLGTLPVDVRIGKLMLLGAIFRCLDPALTIAACLSFKSPFVTPFGKKHEATQKKLEFAAANSDHLTMLNAYNAWLEVKRAGGQAAFRFCQDNFLSKRSLEMLMSMKQQFVELLSDIGFVKEGLTARDVERAAREGGDGVTTVTGQEANLNSKRLKLVAAVLVGALYPNVIQVLTPEQQYAQTGGGAVAIAPKPEDIRFKTKPDGYVKIHPSSVNFQVRHYESPYLVYHEKVKTSRIFIRDCTMVSVYPLLLFGGGDIGVELSRGNFILSVDDGWIRFMAQSHQVAELVRELRLELDALLSDKIETPHLDLCSCPRGSRIINTIVKLITSQ